MDSINKSYLVLIMGVTYRIKGTKLESKGGVIELWDGPVIVACFTTGCAVVREDIIDIPKATAKSSIHKV